MPLDLNTSIDFLKERVDKTRSVQGQIVSTWLWPLKSVAEWEADGEALDKTVEGSLAQVAIEAHTHFESATGVLEARMHAIHVVTVSAVGVMRVRAQRQPESKAVVDELSARGTSRREIEDEGTALLSAWELEFDGAAFSPAPGVTFGAFRELFYGRAADPAATPPVTAIASLRDLKKTQSDKATIDRREAGRLNKRLALIERDCQDWYAEATKAFAEGTEIGDLIRSEVRTTSDYNPPTPGTPPPAPPTPTP